MTRLIGIRLQQLISDLLKCSAFRGIQWSIAESEKKYVDLIHKFFIYYII